MPRTHRDTVPTTPTLTVRAGLPPQRTSFVGRERELAEARLLLQNTRLLTLTGPGGCGKTRLAIRLAADADESFPDGMYFVSLAPIGDPALVLSSIAQRVGLQDSRERPLIEHLIDYLRERPVLLVLDNFEHLLPAATAVGDLVAETTALKVIVTSRACLHLSGEQEFAVPPLALPDSTTPRKSAALAECEAVRLFVERARAVLPSFEMGESNAEDIIRIVSRLDGLPLAIELAAAQVKLLPPHALLLRLENSLGLLVGGARDLPDRQQTLRGTIAWSYSLLSPSAQRLLAVCSIFRGGASLERIESVSERVIGADRSVLETLAELVDHSLVRGVETPGTARFAMLETVREYAAERLVDFQLERQIGGRHAAEFLACAEEGERQLRGPAEKVWLKLLDLEHNNIRAAIDWLGRTSPRDGLALAVAMRPFWSARGHYTEGRQYLRALIQRLSGEASPIRMRGLQAAGWLAVDQGDYAEAEAMLSDSLRLSRELNDAVGEGLSLAHLGRCMIAKGNPVEAIPYLDAAIPIVRAGSDQSAVAVTLLYLGLAANFTGNPRQACRHFEASAHICRQIGFRSLAARALQLLGIARLELGDLSGARHCLAEALPISVELEDGWVIPQEIGGLAAVAARRGKARQALKLTGFAAAYSRAHDFSVPPIMHTTFERWLAPARHSLASAASRYVSLGEHMHLEQAVASALADEPEDASPGGLSAREEEVADRVARGLSNREIASELTLSVRTVEVHVDHILRKLDLHSRTQLAAWAHQARSPQDT